MYGFSDTVRLLLDAGVRDADALEVAARNGHTEIVRMLLDAGASQISKSNGLENAVVAEKYETFELILASFTSTPDPAYYQWSLAWVLARAARVENARAAAALLAAGVKPTGYALVSAVGSGNREIVEMLLQAGASDGMYDALVYARNLGHTEIANLIEKYM